MGGGGRGEGAAGSGVLVSRLIRMPTLPELRPLSPLNYKFERNHFEA